MVNISSDNAPIDFGNPISIVTGLVRIIALDVFLDGKESCMSLHSAVSIENGTDRSCACSNKTVSRMPHQSHTGRRPPRP